MKAILITESTITMLASRYRIDAEDYADRLPMGYWFVTDFGEEIQSFDVVTAVNFDLWFVVVGDILNGWKEVIAL